MPDTIDSRHDSLEDLGFKPLDALDDLGFKPLAQASPRPATPPPPPGVEEPPSLFTQAGRDLKRGAYRALSSLTAGMQALTPVTGAGDPMAAPMAPTRVEKPAQDVEAARQSFDKSAEAIPVSGPKSFTEIGNPDDFVRYGTRILMENIPNMAASVMGGIGAGAKGASAVSYLLNAGEVYNNLREKGLDRPALAAAVGVPMAVLDVLEPLNIASKANPEASKWLWKRIAGQVGEALEQQSTDKLLKRAAKGAAEGFLAEAPTEMAQEALGVGAEKYATGEPVTWQDAARVAEAGVAGGLTGTTMGAAGGVPRVRTPVQAEATPTPAPAVPPAPPPVQPVPPQPAQSPPVQPKPETPLKPEDTRQTTVKQAAPVDVDGIYPEAVKIARNSPTFGRTKLMKALGVDIDQANEIIARLEKDGHAFPDRRGDKVTWHNRPKTQEAAAAPAEPAAPEVPAELPTAFVNDKGQYEMVDAQDGWVRYRFLRNDGQVVEQRMTDQDWLKVAGMSMPVADQPVANQPAIEDYPEPDEIPDLEPLDSRPVEEPVEDLPPLEPIEAAPETPEMSPEMKPVTEPARPLESATEPAMSPAIQPEMIPATEPSDIEPVSPAREPIPVTGREEVIQPPEEQGPPLASEPEAAAKPPGPVEQSTTAPVSPRKSLLFPEGEPDWRAEPDRRVDPPVAEPQAPRPSPRPVDETPEPAQAPYTPEQQQVHDAALALTGGSYEQRVRLKDLRPQMKGLTRAQQDALLTQMQADGKLVLYRNDDPMDRGPADDEAALLLGGDARRDLIYLKRPSAQAAAQTERGPHGPVFREFHHDARGAVAKLREAQSGEAVGALHHPAVGDIDLIWGAPGKKGYGLAKIIERHPEVVDRLQEILDSSTETQRSDQTVWIEDEKHTSIIRLNWKQEEKKWLLTAYERREGSGAPSAGKSVDGPGTHATDRQALPSGGPESSLPKAEGNGNTEGGPVTLGFLGSGYLDELLHRLGEHVKRFIEAVQRYVARRKQSGRKDIERVPFLNEETEGAFQAAKHDPAQAGAIREHWNHFRNGFARTYIHLDPRQYGALIHRLKQLEKSYAHAVHRAVDSLVKTLSHLQPNEYDLFGKVVVLNDMVASLDEAEARGEAWEEMPFGFTPAELRNEHARFNAEAAKHEVIQRALETRREIQRVVKEAYVEAMRRAGYAKDLDETLSRKDYYHHRVLLHLGSKNLAGKGKLNLPTGRGFLKQRHMNSLAFSTDYLSSEFEVLQQMMHDTARAETLAWVRDEQNGINKTGKAKAAAKEHNKAATMPHFEAIAVAEGTTAEAVYRRVMNWRIAKAMKDLEKMGGSLPASGQWADLVADLAAGTADAREVNNYAAWLLRETDPSQYAEAHKAARALFAAYRHRTALTKQLAGKNYVDPRDTEGLLQFMPGHVAWQPEQGNTFYMAATIGDDLAAQLTEGLAEALQIRAEDVRKTLALAGRKPSIVIPEEVAATLNELSLKRDTNVFDAAMKHVKQTMLLFALRAAKYIMRNLTGDADIVFVGNPRAFRWVGRAIRDLRSYRDGKMSPEFQEWFNRGGIESTFAFQELADLKQLDELAHLFDPAMKKTQPIDAMKKAWMKWTGMNQTQKAARFSEAILRYANFLEYADQMKAGGKPRNFGASIPEVVMSLDNVHDRAFKLSNDLLGAYDEVSVHGQKLRRYLIPFWSFTEINFRRYYRLMKNAIRDDRAAGTMGVAMAGPKMAARLGVVGLVKLGRTGLAVMGLKALTHLWNHLLFPDEEDDLTEEQRKKAHIILGRNAAGNVISFDRVGSSDDLLEWIGAEGLGVYVKHLMDGTRTPQEIAAEMAKSPVNKVWGSIGPHYKAPFELAAGMQSYPDVTNWRGIRDRGEYVARMFGAGEVYRTLRGKPTQPGMVEGARSGDVGKVASGAKQALTKLLTYETDPGQVAYYDTKDMIRRWKGDTGSYSGKFDVKSQALYDTRMAIRYGDKRALEKNLTDYFAYGGTEKGLRQSIDRMHPLAGLKKSDRDDFMDSLTTEQKLRVDRALRFYEEHFVNQSDAMLDEALDAAYAAGR